MGNSLFGVKCLNDVSASKILLYPLEISFFQFDLVSVILKSKQKTFFNHPPKIQTYEYQTDKLFSFCPDISFRIKIIFAADQYQAHTFSLGRES
jgi:hypothetical protein